VITITPALQVAAALQVSALTTQYAEEKVWAHSATQVLCVNQDVAMKISAQT